MRKLVLGILLVFPFCAQAITRTSVANGNWNDPNVWSPVGIPQPADDSIIVATNIFINGYNVIVGNPYFEIGYTGSLSFSDTLAFGGNEFIMNNVVQGNVCVFGASDSVVVNFELVVAELIQSGTMINNWWICISQQLTTSDDFINNGSVACNNWINSGNVTGNQGQFCIAQNFINTDQISGSIDICDASPGGFGDVNMGTISGSVTNCTAGPCSSCPIPGFQEYEMTLIVSIAPHPVSGVALIKVEGENVQSNSQNIFTLTDVQGRIVDVVPFAGSSFIFDRGVLEDGLYFFTLTLENQIQSSGRLLIQ